MLADQAVKSVGAAGLAADTGSDPRSAVKGGSAGFRDLDGDHDGTTNVVEASGADADFKGDGNMDNFGDVNLNGVNRNCESAGSLPFDTDDNGFTNGMGLGSANDGIDEPVEDRYCANNAQGKIESKHIPGAMPWQRLSRSEVVAAALFFSKSRAQRIGALSLLAMTASLAGCGVMSGSSSEQDALIDKDVRENNPVENENRGFSRNVYGVAGLGVSYLEPDTNDNEDVRVTDEVDIGAQIGLGVDLSRQLSLEVNAADLGSAELTNGQIDYRMLSGSALIYMGKNRKRDKRQGLTGFARLGYGSMDNSSTGSVEYDNINSTHVLVGAGLEYTSRMGLGVRGEFISFDTDAKSLQVGLIYRLGLQRNGQKQGLATVEPAARPGAALKAPSAAAVAQGSAEDGVSAGVDNCPKAISGAIVGSDGCALFSGVAEGVTFLSNSGELTEEAKGILDSVAQTLSLYPEAIVNIKAHTDNQGAASYNQSLSEVRAKSVARHLYRQGISISNMAARAYGESQPIDTNDTVEGRERNRRVEIYVTTPNQ